MILNVAFGILDDLGLRRMITARCVSGKCTGKDNEAHEKDPVEESRKAGVDLQ
jgi:hypothetical protein